MPPKSRSKDKGKGKPSSSSTSSLAGGQLPKSTAYEQTRDNLIVASKVIEAISEATDLLKPLKATCQVLRLALETTQAINDNTEEWDALKRKLESHLASLDDQCSAISDESGETKIVEAGFFNPLKAYIMNLESLQDAILSAQARRSGIKGFFKKISGVRIEAGLIRTYTRDIDDHFREFTSALQIFVAEFIQRMNKTVQRVDDNVEAMGKNIDRMLPSVDVIALNHLNKARTSKLVHEECLQGTRVPILEKIRQWADDSGREKQILWLNDVAGSGKSTVATTMANEWRGKNRLGGRFFFSMSDESFAGTAGFCSAIARDLHAFIPSLRSAIQDAAVADTAIATRSFEEQFTKLIAEPLRDHSQTVMLVIDAVDECKDHKERKAMLQTIVKTASTVPHLKVLMTSRPEPDISAIISSAAVVCNMEFRLHGVEHKYNMDDIAAYINHHLSDILTDQQRAELVEKAGGLFIWASTAKKILEESPKKSGVVLEALISTSRSSELADIDSLYELVLRRALPSEGWQDLLCSALGVLAVVNEPISISTLSELMPVEGRLEEIMRRLGSVLKFDGEDGRIHFRHPTFLEYLRRCDSSPLRIDTGKAHVDIAITTLRLLGDLKMDVLDIWKRGTRIPFNDEVENVESLLISRIAEITLYSAKHWSFHAGVTLENTKVLESMKTFLKTGLLNWLELVVWMRYVAKALAGLLYLRKILGRYAGYDHTLIRGWVYEAAKFAQSHQGIIEKAALHAHLSAILFSPHETWIYETYSGVAETKMPRALSGIPKTWPTHQILAGHSGSINRLAFSPDGKRVVSGSQDNTLRLWDAESGAQVGSALEGHSSYIRCLAFSPDGKRITSGSADSTVRLWDVDSGAQVVSALEGHSYWITCLALSPDGKRVVSGSQDKTLRLWDAESGAQIGSALQGHSEEITCLAFSPDGKRVVSGSQDNTLRLWDAESGAQIGSTLQGHSHWIICLAFSPDGKRVVSGSRDEALRLWDAESGTQIGSVLQGHSNWITCLAFSPDGKRVVSGSYDNTLRLWDAESGAQIGSALQGHSDVISCLKFSPDGKRVLSSSRDKTLRLWDADSGAQTGSTLEGHSEDITCHAFSPDGKRVVSGSRDKTLRLWDAESGAQAGRTLEEHSEEITCLAFSPDGKRVVSGSQDNTLRLWDAESGAQIGSVLQGHSEGIICLAFSPDGKRVVSGSRDNTLRLWDAESGAQIGNALQGHSHSISCLAFSPDGKRVVSGSQDNTLRLWDTDSCAQIGGVLEGHSYRIGCLAFSPDGKRVVSGSDDNTLRLWDADSGAQVGSALGGHSSFINCLAFSPDGKRVASGSEDHTLRLWDADSGAQVGSALEGHSSSVSCLAFSPDGKRIVSGSYDDTLRLWDAESGGLVATIDIGTTHSVADPCFSPDSSTVYYRGRTWRISPSGPVEEFGQIPISSQPTSLSPITYEHGIRGIAVSGMPEHNYLLPLTFVVRTWEAYGGVVALGAESGSVMIIDFTDILRGGS